MGNTERQDADDGLIQYLVIWKPINRSAAPDATGHVHMTYYSTSKYDPFIQIRGEGRGNGTVYLDKGSSYIDAANWFKTQLDLPSGTWMMVVRKSPTGDSLVTLVIDSNLEPIPL